MASLSMAQDRGTGSRNVSTASDERDRCNSRATESLRCFVCDMVIQSRHYALATCKTQSSRSRVIEKLGELVGDRYMVVISEDDVICRSCANLINTLDRLEVEMRNVRENVLRFLEQKYSLEEGELLGSIEGPKLSQPPQITKCTDQNANNYETKKRGASALYITEKARRKKNNVWVKCDKCQYTTLHNSFMVHHIRDHIKQKEFCNRCGTQFAGHKEKSHDCNVQDQLGNSKMLRNREPESPAQDMSENVMDVPVLEKTIEQSVPIMSLQTYSDSRFSDHNENPLLIRLSNSDSLHIDGILTNDSASVTAQPAYVRVLQSVEVNEGSVHPTMVAHSDSDSDVVVKMKDNSGKQILTLTEDGSLEMVDISCWTDIQSSESGPSIAFP